MGLVATKPVFGVLDKVRFTPASLASETSKKIEISLIESLDMILSKKRIKKALISLRLYCSQTPEDRFCRDEAKIVVYHS